jgi:hypothetical protein
MPFNGSYEVKYIKRVLGGVNWRSRYCRASELAYKADHRIDPVNKSMYLTTLEVRQTYAKSEYVKSMLNSGLTLRLVLDHVYVPQNFPPYYVKFVPSRRKRTLSLG